METEGSLPHSQVPATCPYPGPDQASPCPPPQPTYWRSILKLSSNLRLGLPSGLFPSDFPTNTLYSPLPHACYMPRVSPRFDHPNNIWWGLQIQCILIYNHHSTQLRWPRHENLHQDYWHSGGWEQELGSPNRKRELIRRDDEVLAAVLLTIQVFCDVTLCWMVQSYQCCSCLWSTTVQSTRRNIPQDPNLQRTSLKYKVVGLLFVWITKL